MAARVSLAGLMLLTSLATSTVVADEKKKDPPKNPAEEKSEPKEKIVPAGDLVGRVVRVEGTQKYLTLQVSVPYQEPVAHGNRVILRLNFKPVDVELQAADDIKVRLAVPPVEYDEKGRPKKYTTKELSELKGREKLWGYPGDFDSLKPDQVVRVFLSRNKESSVRPKAKKDKDQDADTLSDNKPTVTRVYILAEARK